MSILNDKQIRELCTLPTAFVNHIVPYQHEDGTMGSVVVTKPTHDSIEVIREKMRLEHIGAVVQPGDRYTLMELFDANDPVHVAKINKPMIEPFVCVQVKTRLIPNRNQDSSFRPLEKEEQKIISFGLSSFGYDFRVANQFKIFTNVNSTVVDPLNFKDNCFVDFVGDVCIVPPNSFVLARTMERFTMPDDVVGVCTGKSTIARSGLSIMVTPLEPGWSGYLTLEYANTTPLPVKLYAGMGGGQIMFYKGDRPDVTYSDRNGKYQNQLAEPIPPKV